jgi:next-to-BRCA1 protein 1
VHIVWLWRMNEHVLYMYVVDYVAVHIKWYAMCCLLGFESTSKTARHVNVQCDICNSKDFIGVRYKCSTCPDFDVCSRCIDQVEDENLHPHTFLRVSKPIPMLLAHENGAIPTLANRSEWIHHGVSCNNCEIASSKDKQDNKITGYRYFCTMCAISLCEQCEQTCGHESSLALLKMVPPPEPRRSKK